MQYIVAAQTDVGTVKQVNQDSLTVKIVDTSRGEIALTVICDGMGGLKLGEVASASVVATFQDWFYNVLPILLKNPIQKEDIKNNWMDIVFRENEKIMQYGYEHKVSLGTTLTAMLFLEHQYYILHIGDCRVYQMTDRLQQITKDQTFVAREIALGRMTAEEAKTDNRRNILLQCVGVNKDIEPEFFSGVIPNNATYLICTDGFRHEITEQEIYEYCNPMRNNHENDMNQNLRYLIQLNKERKERDNISAVLIRCGE